jgi:hypothetical protein
MLSLRTGLTDTGTSSARGLCAAVSPNRTSVRELLQVALSHHRYVQTGGRTGPLGYPVADVRSNGALALRDYRGGQVHVLGSGQAVAGVRKAVDADWGRVEIGDLLTTSPTPGHAMLADDPARAFSAVIGKVLRPLTTARGLIPILIAP